PNVRHRYETKRSVPRVEKSILMLPHTLKRSKRPAEALFGKVPQVVGSFGISDRSFLVTNAMTLFSYLDSKVLIFGECIGRKAAYLFKDRSSPCSDRAWNYRHPVK